MASIIGTENNDNFQGTNEDDVIFSGGVSSHFDRSTGIYEHIHGNGGSDTLVLNADDTFLEGSGGSGRGHLIIHDFTVGNVTENNQADSLDIGAYLRGSNLTAENIGNYLFIVSGINNHYLANSGVTENDSFIFVNKEGNFTEADKQNLAGDFYAVERNADSAYGAYGYGHGADLLIEVRGEDSLSNNFAEVTGHADNSVEQFQALIDLGFLDVSNANSEPVNEDTIFELSALGEGEDIFGSNFDEVIYSGGLTGNWQSIESKGGSDRLVLDEDDMHAGGNDAHLFNARVTVRDFTIDDVTVNDQADIFDIGAFLDGENLDATNVGDYLHVITKYGGTAVFINKEGRFTDEDRAIIDASGYFGEVKSSNADLVVDFQNEAGRADRNFTIASFDTITGYENNTIEQFQALIDLGFLVLGNKAGDASSEIPDGNTDSGPVDNDEPSEEANIIRGTSGADNINGTAADEVIYSGGVDGINNGIYVNGDNEIDYHSNVNAESIAGVGGSDRLVLERDAGIVQDQAGNSNGHIRIRDFKVADVSNDVEADVLDLGNFFDEYIEIDASNAGKYLHISSDIYSIFLNREGDFSEEDHIALNEGRYAGGHGSDLLLEFKPSLINSGAGVITNNFAALTGEEDNTVEQFQALIDLGFLVLPGSNVEPEPPIAVSEVVGTSEADLLQGTANDEVIFSGGISSGIETVYGGGGADTLVFDNDDSFVADQANDDNGHLRIKDFIIDDTSTNTDADVLDIGAFLLGSNLDASTIGDYLHVVSGTYGQNRSGIFVDREGHFSDQDRVNLTNNIFDGGNGADLFLEFQGQVANNNLEEITGYADNTVEQFQSLIDLGFLDISKANSDAVPAVVQDDNGRFQVVGTAAGDGSSQNSGLQGRENSDDDIFSGGVGNGEVENVQGVDSTALQLNARDVRGTSLSNIDRTGNDRLIITGDDAFATDASTGNGHIRVRGFTVGDVDTEMNADSLVIGDLLRHDDNSAGFLGTAEDAVRFLHFVEGGTNIMYLYIDRDGGLGDANSEARQFDSVDDNGLLGDANFLLEFRTLHNSEDNVFNFNPNGNELNTAEQIQSLIDLGFLDLGASAIPADVSDVSRSDVHGTEENDGTGSIGTGLIGESGRNDDFFSGGLSTGSENIQGVAGSLSRTQYEGSGNDRLILDADDQVVSQDDGVGASDGYGSIRLRGFTIGDTEIDSDADTIILGDLLRGSFVDADNDGLDDVTGLAQFNGTAADAVRFLHFEEGGVQKEAIYIDVHGELGDVNDSSRSLVESGNSIGGIVGGSSLMLRFYTFDSLTYDTQIDFNANGSQLNTEEQIQALVDLGFLDLGGYESTTSTPAPTRITIQGTESADDLTGSSESDIFLSEGLSHGVENIRGNGGSDILFLNADDAIARDIADDSNAHFRIRDFIIDDVSANDEADILDISDLLSGYSIDSSDIGSHLHIVSGTFGTNRSSIFIDLDGEFSDDERVALSTDAAAGGQGADLFLEFQGYAANNNFEGITGFADNTAEQLQSLIDMGFLEVA